jgi:hypothetical protein
MVEINLAIQTSKEIDQLSNYLSNQELLRNFPGNGNAVITKSSVNSSPIIYQLRVFMYSPN